MVKLFSKIAAGVLIDEQPCDPLFPAEATTTTPAAFRLSTAVSRMEKLAGLQPSDSGHAHELLIT